MLRVGGEPRKTAGPTLRGAARSCTLQKRPRILWVGGEPRKTAGPTLRGAVMEPHTLGGTKSVLGWR